MHKKIRIIFVLYLAIVVALSTTNLAAILGSDYSHAQSVKAASFSPYKAIVNTTKLNIRKGPGTNYTTIGYYSKGTVVDVIGQSGSFLKTSKGYISAAYTKKYTSTSSSSSKTSTFKSYKVKVTTSKLNIRKGAGTKYATIGYYTKGTIVDIVGQSGSFLKTSRGYISSAYTQKYIAPTPTPVPVPTQPTTPTAPSDGSQNSNSPIGEVIVGFQPYKVLINTSRLDIRSGPDTTSGIIGNYIGGNIVEIIGKIGDYLQTSIGYISSQYTSLYTPTVPTGNNSSPAVYTSYIQMKESVPLLLDLAGKQDERYAVAGKSYGVLGQAEEYYRIKIGKTIGYVHTSKATLLTTAPKNKISLAWQYVNTKASNAVYYNSPDDYVMRSSSELGLDVISPTWFYMTGTSTTPASINAAEKGDREYVRIAHKNGYEVWALFQEFNSERANKTFYDVNVRTRVIDQIINYSLQYNVDGVNIDYEGLGKIASNKAGFTLFVKELSEKLKAAGLNVSVDVTKPTSTSIYSTFLDRPVLASYVDYMIYMAYDEHYSSSKKAGSVGSYPWVTTGLKDILAQGVPAEKLILGVPFYLRDFKVVDSFQPYDAVIFSQDGRLYTKPFNYENKLIDINTGYTYKHLETLPDWYKVELEGDVAYIPRTDALINSGNTNLRSLDANINVVFPFDMIITKAISSVYMQPSETSQKLGSINADFGYRCLGISDGWYKINYNGVEAYIMQRDVAFMPQYTSLEEADGKTNIILPYDTITVKNETGLYKQPTSPESQKVIDVKVGDVFRHIGTVAGMPDWYIVDYKGAQVYAQKRFTSFISANTASSRSAVSSSAVSLKTVLSNVSTYKGRTYYDETARQNVAQYYANGYWHMVWLEDTHSMAWRMDIVNQYNLAGAAGWDLNWNPSKDIYNIIKSKLK